MQKYIIAQMETWRLFMVPPQDKVTIVFDLAGFGLRNMDFGSLFCKSRIRAPCFRVLTQSGHAGQTSSSVSRHTIPSRSALCSFIAAPGCEAVAQNVCAWGCRADPPSRSFFQAWKVVKGLLDPVVRSKVAITQKLEEVTPNVPADVRVAHVPASALALPLC